MPTGVYERKHRYGYKSGDPTRRCYRCIEEKPVSEFGPAKRRQDGLRTICNTCRAEQLRMVRALRPELDRAAGARYRDKDREAYRAMKRELYAREREANRAKARAWAAKNRSQTKRAKLKCRYGISQADYDAMFQKQGGVCAICGGPFGETPHIDHCHTTGVVRGLLCRRCNSGLGHIERPGFVQAATAYLAA